MWVVPNQVTGRVAALFVLMALGCSSGGGGGGGGDDGGTDGGSGGLSCSGSPGTSCVCAESDQPTPGATCDPTFVGGGFCCKNSFGLCGCQRWGCASASGGCDCGSAGGPDTQCASTWTTCCESGTDCRCSHVTSCSPSDKPVPSCNKAFVECPAGEFPVPTCTP